MGNTPSGALELDHGHVPWVSHVADMTDARIALCPLGADDARALRLSASEQGEMSRFRATGRTENLTAAAQIQRAPERDQAHEFGIWLTSSSTLVGSIELQGIERHRVNLSYFVSPRFRRRGVATQAALLASRFATSQLGATAVNIKALTSNLASIGVARAIGAREIGRERNDAGWTLRVFELRL